MYFSHARCKELVPIGLVQVMFYLLPAAIYANAFAYGGGIIFVFVR